MKGVALLITAVAVSLLCACVGLPPPEKQGNCLVVGYLAEDYPDGFFQLPPRTVSDGMGIRFTNLTRGSRFTVRTSHGYYYFLSNGTDEYVLESYEWKVEEMGGTSRYSGGGKLGLKLQSVPDKVLYLGHVTVIQTKPQLGKDTLEKDTTYWRFDTKIDFQWKDDDVRGFIRDRDAGSPWLRYALVQHKW